MLTTNTEELSEEDQQLKDDLEMMVERLKVCDPSYEMSSILG